MRSVTLFLTKILWVPEASVDKDEGRSVVSLSAMDGCTEVMSCVVYGPPFSSCQPGARMKLEHFPYWSHFQKKAYSRNLICLLPRAEKRERHHLCILGDNSTLVLALGLFFHFCAWILFARCIGLNITFYFCCLKMLLNRNIMEFCDKKYFRLF